MNIRNRLSGTTKRLSDTIALRAKVADRSLFVKFAAVPAVVLVLLVLVAALSLSALLQAQSSAEQIVDEDMRQIAALNAVSKRFDRADGELYRLLVAKASGAQDVDVSGRAAAIGKELDRAHKDLAGLRPGMANRIEIDAVLALIDQYTDAVDVVTSMLDIDFASSASMLAPFRANALHVARDMDAMAAAGTAEANARAAEITARIRLMFVLVVLATASVAVFGILLTGVIGRATVLSITSIAEATSSLAAANYDIDLDALDRRDELGAVVAALKTFRRHALEARQLQAEKRALEDMAKVDENRHRETVAQTMGDAERERRETLGRLADEFETQVVTMITTAQDAMARLDSSSHRLDKSADSNRALSAELERLAEILTGEMEGAGAATGALTASIRKIDQEVGHSSEVAQAMLEQADRALAAVADSESQAQDIEHVVGVIEQITRQTRLLALNATIEAARVGPAGRGFGVVAAEIKALSNRTGGSTTDVRRQVGAIQTGIGQIVAVTTQLGWLIESMNDVASRVAEVSAGQVRSTDEIDERIGVVRSRTEALVEASAAIRDSAIDNQSFVGELRLAAKGMHNSLTELGRDAQAFTGYLRAS